MTDFISKYSLQQSIGHEERNLPFFSWTKRYPHSYKYTKVLLYTYHIYLVDYSAYDTDYVLRMGQTSLLQYDT